MQEHESKNKNDQLIGKIVWGYIIVRILYNTVRRFLHFNSMMSGFFLMIMILAYIFHNCRFLLKKLYASFKLYIVIATLFSGVYYFTYLRENIELGTMFRYEVYLLFLCIPFFIVGKYVFSLSGIVEYWTKNMNIMIIIASLVLLTGKEKDYNMSYSYLTLLPTLVCLHNFIKKKDLHYFLCFVYLCSLIIIFGSRGPLLCIALYLIMLFVFGSTRVTYKSIFFLLLLLICKNYKNIAIYVMKFMNMHGIQNRTIELLMMNLTYSSGRDRIQKKTIDVISKNWLIGTGPASDIKLIGDYPHNFFLEIIMDYGIAVGMGIIIWILFLIARGLMVKCYRGETILFISWAFIPLMVSGTYLTSFSFPFMLGILINMKKIRNNKKYMKIEGNLGGT